MPTYRVVRQVTTTSVLYVRAASEEQVVRYLKRKGGKPFHDEVTVVDHQVETTHFCPEVWDVRIQ